MLGSYLQYRLAPNSATTICLAINYRHRVDPLYFDKAIQSIPTTAAVGEVVTRELGWGATLLHGSGGTYEVERVGDVVGEWKGAPQCFLLRNPDGSVLTMGNSPRFPMYDKNFEWGHPMAVCNGWANKFDDKLLAFHITTEDGELNSEFYLAPNTLVALVSDPNFMGYKSE